MKKKKTSAKRSKSKRKINKNNLKKARGGEMSLTAQERALMAKVHRLAEQSTPPTQAQWNAIQKQVFHLYSEDS